MTERDMTADERQDFETSELHRDGGGTRVEPAGRRRTTRARSKTPSTGPGPDEFNPSSRGDERGEVM